jgi:hypothetical protein
MKAMGRKGYKEPSKKEKEFDALVRQYIPGLK